MKQSKETIRGYFQTGDKPKQVEYYDTWDSFWHKDEALPIEFTDGTNTVQATAAGVVDLSGLDFGGNSEIGSNTNGEPIGSDQILNIVSLTQAEYDAGTPVATTLYNITDA